jgi:hypothetical protein
MSWLSCQIQIGDLFSLSLMGWDWLHLVPSTLFGLLYQPQKIDGGDYGVTGGMTIGTGNLNTRRKTTPVPLCSPQIPRDLIRARTLAAAVGSRRLTAWAMAWLTVSSIKSLWFGRVLSSGIYRRVEQWKSTNVPEENVSSTFRAEEYAKHETSVKQVASRATRYPRAWVTLSCMYLPDYTVMHLTRPSAYWTLK